MKLQLRYFVVPLLLFNTYRQGSSRCYCSCIFTLHPSHILKLGSVAASISVLFAMNEQDNRHIYLYKLSDFVVTYSAGNKL